MQIAFHILLGCAIAYLWHVTSNGAVAKKNNGLMLPNEFSHIPDINYSNASFELTTLAQGFGAYSPTCLTYTVANTWRTAFVGSGHASGKHYYEFKVVREGPTKHYMIGVARKDFVTSNYLGSDGAGYSVGYQVFHKVCYYGNKSFAFPGGCTGNCTVGLLMDMDLKLVTLYVNGEAMGAAAGSAQITTGTWYAAVSTNLVKRLPLTSPHK